MVRRKIISTPPSFGRKRQAFMKVILGIIENNEADTIDLTKNKIKDMMRAITDYCAADNYLYKNPKRSRQTYQYSEAAWELRDSEENKGLKGDHCVPLNSIVEYIIQRKREGNFPEYEIRDFLDKHLEVVMITKEEDDDLTANGMRSVMPEGWEYYGNKYARYEQLGIKLEKVSMLNDLKTKT